MLNGISSDSIWIEVTPLQCMLDVCSVDCIYPLMGEDCDAGCLC